jgi:uncharacterized membrane protein
VADRRLAWCLLLASAQAGCVMAGVPAWMTLPIGILMIFVVPGYALLRASGRWDPALPGRTGLVVVTSIGSVALGGLVLNLLPTGLTATSWSVGLLMVVAASAALVWKRDGWRTPPDAPRPALPAGTTIAKALVCLTLVGVAAAVALTSQTHLNQRETYTELSINPHGAGHEVHVRNREGSTVGYVVEVHVGGQAPENHAMRLADDASWSRAVVSPAAARVRGRRPAITVDLYRAGDARRYRRVVLNGTTS